MADFKAHQRLFHVYPSVGNPVTYRFDEGKMDVILKNIQKYVRIVRTAVEDSATETISSIEIHDIEV